MEIEFYLYSLLIIPLLAGRAMMTVFGSALAAYLTKYPGLFEFFDYALDVDALGLLTGLPEWMQSPWFLVLSFVLAFMERAISRSPELQDFWNITEAKLKGIFAFVICFMLVKGDPQHVLEHAKNVSTDFQGFLSIEYVWSFVVGCLTWFLSKLRSGVYAFLIEIDDGDDLGLRSMLGRIEGAMGVCGPLIFVIVPSLALMAAALSVLIILSLKFWVKKVGKKHQVPCEECQHLNHLSALHCGKCDKKRVDPKAVGFMGLSKKDEPAGDLGNHRFDLLRVGRCQNCGESNSVKAVSAVCGTCHQDFFKNGDDVRSYLGYIRKRLGKTILVTSIFGLIPIVGLIPGIVFYRLYLIAGLRNYVSKGSNFFIRFFLRIFFVLIIMFQVTPIFGFIVIPIMALANYFLYSSAIKSQIGAHEKNKILQSELPTIGGDSG